jgi:hypothetical protein
MVHCPVEGRGSLPKQLHARPWGLGSGKAEIFFYLKHVETEADDSVTNQDATRQGKGGKNPERHTEQGGKMTVLAAGNDDHPLLLVHGTTQRVNLSKSSVV